MFYSAALSIGRLNAMRRLAHMGPAPLGQAPSGSASSVSAASPGIRPSRFSPRLVLGSLLLLTLLAAQAEALDPDLAWKRADSILSRITPPAFPDAVLDITRFGARADGTSDCTDAFARAIDACARQGGGTVLVPRGEFLTGPIHLKSNVNLHLADGAVVKFQRDPARYLPVVLTRWEGVECMNYSPFIYAYGQTNIALTGKGTLDGQANEGSWWGWNRKKETNGSAAVPLQKAARDRLFAMGQAGVPVSERLFGEGSFLRPNFIQFYRCSNVLVQDVRIINSPMWEIHPVLCSNVSVLGVAISSHGPNNDGCDPESSRDVLIRDCTFDTGDDCIAIKSGRNNDGRRLMTPSENIIVQRCTFKDGHGAVTIGSEVSGGARNVFAEHCTAESPVLYSALRIKSNAQRGGVVEDVYLRDFDVRLVDQAVVNIDLFYEEGKNGTFLPAVRRIGIERMTVDTCNIAFNLVGYEEAPLRDILLKDCDFRKVAGGYTVSDVCGLVAVNSRINGRAFAIPAAGIGGEKP